MSFVYVSGISNKLNVSVVYASGISSNLNVSSVYASGIKSSKVFLLYMYPASVPS